MAQTHPVLCISNPESHAFQLRVRLESVAETLAVVDAKCRGETRVGASLWQGQACDDGRPPGLLSTSERLVLLGLENYLDPGGDQGESRCPHSRSSAGSNSSGRSRHCSPASNLPFPSEGSSSTETPEHCRRCLEESLGDTCVEEELYDGCLSPQASPSSRSASMQQSPGSASGWSSRSRSSEAGRCMSPSSNRSRTTPALVPLLNLSRCGRLTSISAAASAHSSNSGASAICRPTSLAIKRVHRRTPGNGAADGWSGGVAWGASMALTASCGVMRRSVDGECPPSAVDKGSKDTDLRGTGSSVREVDGPLYTGAASRRGDDDEKLSLSQSVAGQTSRAVSARRLRSIRKQSLAKPIFHRRNSHSSRSPGGVSAVAPRSLADDSRPSRLVAKRSTVASNSARAAGLRSCASSAVAPTAACNPQHPTVARGSRGTSGANNSLATAFSSAAFLGSSFDSAGILMRGVNGGGQGVIHSERITRNKLRRAPTCASARPFVVSPVESSRGDKILRNESAGSYTRRSASHLNAVCQTLEELAESLCHSGEAMVEQKRMQQGQLGHERRKNKELEQRIRQLEQANDMLLEELASVEPPSTAVTQGIALPLPDDWDHLHSPLEDLSPSCWCAATKRRREGEDSRGWGRPTGRQDGRFPTEIPKKLSAIRFGAQGICEQPDRNGLELWPSEAAILQARQTDAQEPPEGSNKSHFRQPSLKRSYHRMLSTSKPVPIFSIRPHPVDAVCSEARCDWCPKVDMGIQAEHFYRQWQLQGRRNKTVAGVHSLSLLPKEIAPISVSVPIPPRTDIRSTTSSETTKDAFESALPTAPATPIVLVTTPPRNPDHLTKITGRRLPWSAAIPATRVSSDSHQRPCSPPTGGHWQSSLMRALSRLWPVCLESGQVRLRPGRSRRDGHRHNGNHGKVVDPHFCGVGGCQRGGHRQDNDDRKTEKMQEAEKQAIAMVTAPHSERATRHNRLGCNPAVYSRAASCPEEPGILRSSTAPSRPGYYLAASKRLVTYPSYLTVMEANRRTTPRSTSTAHTVNWPGRIISLLNRGISFLINGSESDAAADASGERDCS